MDGSTTSLLWQRYQEESPLPRGGEPGSHPRAAAGPCGISPLRSGPLGSRRRSPLVPFEVLNLIKGWRSSMYEAPRITEVGSVQDVTLQKGVYYGDGNSHMGWPDEAPTS